ncbi:MurR/RpiR family transcriptional regulator [uncultured Enterococcus sp.]|uniref:MurR/RpiR family transcriptional regulator n=1 Tax=uncultured Enterococcus sp. TaxID=167972 RepID=UPI002AA92B63|nr:MurR/RpiR family transcriptional regulator [uncultured Enterococcus sp.]
MLLLEKIELTRFSPTEKMVVDFMLEKRESIEKYSTTMIAGETYTSPSLLSRIAKKLDFKGWSELKKEFLNEIAYLDSNFKNLDANLPFKKSDSIMAITNKVAQLKIESLKDTLTLIHHDSLQKAIRLIETHDTVKIFCLSNLIFLGEEFVFKMRHINKKAEIYPIQNTMFQEAVMTTNKDCAIFISYSGESDPLFKTVQLLKRNKVPIIAITSIGDNQLSRLADITLHVTTREKSFSKVAGFSSIESISLVLDALYSCYFAINFEENYEYKIKLAQATELRQIDNQIVREDC